MDEPTFAKSVDYTKAKSNFLCKYYLRWLILSLIILLNTSLCLLFFKRIIWLRFNRAVHCLHRHDFSFGLPNVPFNLWETFKLEERFGFNKSNLSLWVSDQIKGLALSLVIGVPLLMSLMWIVSQMGTFWWLWAFVFLWLFQVVMIVLYPMFIYPFQ